MISGRLPALLLCLAMASANAQIAGEIDQAHRHGDEGSVEAKAQRARLLAEGEAAEEYRVKRVDRG